MLGPIDALLVTNAWAPLENALRRASPSLEGSADSIAVIDALQGRVPENVIDTLHRLRKQRNAAVHQLVPLPNIFGWWSDVTSAKRQVLKCVDQSYRWEPPQALSFTARLIWIAISLGAIALGYSRYSAHGGQFGDMALFWGGVIAFFLLSASFWKRTAQAAAVLFGAILVLALVMLAGKAVFDYGRTVFAQSLEVPAKPPPSPKP